MILYLALHFFHHNFQGAFRLELLDKVIKKYKLREKDWLGIKFKMAEFSLNNFVEPVFYLLRKYFRTPIPRLINGKKIEVNIFDSEPRIVSGIKRFRNLLFLSPNSFWRKTLIFLNPGVIYSSFFVLKERLFYSSRDISKNH